jgi:FAD/FMN-containing dehydrogenase
MKNIFLKSLLILTVSLGTLSSCVNSDNYSTPESTLTTYELTTTTTVAAVNLAASANSITEYTTDDIIEAYVTSNDESGTFYKSISFQTIPTDASAPIGFSVPINATTLYGKGFTPGRKVFIKLKGLYIGKIFGSLQIGSLYEGTIGRISEFEWKNHLFPSGTKVAEDSFVRTLTLADAYKDINQNTLVELDLVQFADGSINRTYYDVDSGGGATNHLLTATTGGTQRIIRFSSFAPFTGKQVPSGSGKIRGVLSKYNTDFQFVVRYESDIKLTSARADVNPTIVGNATAFSAILNEPFNGYSSNQTNFPKYINDAFVGNRYWQLKSFGSNSYIEQSAYNGSGNPGLNLKTYFFVPVDFSAANNFTFKEAMRFNAGNALKVYYVTSADYAPGSVVDIKKFTNITSSFNISYPALGASENTITSAGVYAIPTTLTGTGYFVFEYTGSATITTTVQIDDIVIN